MQRYSSCIKRLFEITMSISVVLKMKVHGWHSLIYRVCYDPRQIFQAGSCGIFFVEKFIVDSMTYCKRREEEELLLTEHRAACAFPFKCMQGADKQQRRLRSSIQGNVVSHLNVSSKSTLQCDFGLDKTAFSSKCGDWELSAVPLIKISW